MKTTKEQKVQALTEELETTERGTTMTTKMTKAQMFEELQALKKQNEEMQAKLEQIESGKKEKKFNVWNNTYFKLAKEYLNAEKKTTFEITVKHYNDKDFTDKKTGEEVHIDGTEKVLRYLQKNGILKIGGLTPDIVEGKEVYHVLIKEFNIDGELEGKKGKYNPFEYAITKLTA